MLQSKLSYTQIGLFSMAAYPYSLKLLWSPVVDSVYSARVGRRKSWIIPMQVRKAVPRGAGGGVGGLLRSRVCCYVMQ